MTLSYVAIMASSQPLQYEFERESVVRGHHIYKDVWTPQLNEELQLQREPGNEHDRHAVAVVKSSTMVGHVPRTISRVCWFFLGRGGQIICRITGHRRYGNGLEVPCVYIFRSSSSKDITKLKTLMATPRETLYVVDTSQNIEP